VTTARAIGLALAFLAAGAAAAFAQQGTVAAPQFDPAKPIHIQSERLEVDNESETIRFEGNVVAVQDDAILNSDVLLIYYDKPKKSGARSEPGPGALGNLPQAGGDISRMVALGRVQFNQGDRHAACERADFDQQKGTITMTGNPLVTQGKDVMRGDTIVINVKNQGVEVRGGAAGRVSVTISPRTAEKNLGQDKEPNGSEAPDTEKEDQPSEPPSQ
jgi:lipopolysaccharide export system protein LptA